MGAVQQIDLLRLSLSLSVLDLRYRIRSGCQQPDANERGKCKHLWQFEKGKGDREGEGERRQGGKNLDERYQRRISTSEMN